MLAVHNLEVVYEGVLRSLRGASLAVAPDRIVAVLGANGAGKTTLLRAMTGLLDVHRGKITRGQVSLDGKPLDTRRAAAVVRAGVSQVMEGRRVFVPWFAVGAGAPQGWQPIEQAPAARCPSPSWPTAWPRPAARSATSASTASSAAT